MSDSGFGRPDDTIRISRQEAVSPHVDDLLKRQRSLRGEGGVTRGRRAWYYQNWFVFMLVGTLAALAAWAIIEPYFDDFLYIDGKIAAISAQEAGRNRIDLGGDSGLELNFPVQGTVQIGSTKVWILKGAKILGKDGAKLIEGVNTFQVGQNVGMYVEYHQGPGVEIALAVFVVLDPPPRAKQLGLSQQEAQKTAGSLLLFPLVAGLVGLAIGAVDGVICRTFRRALLAGTVGLLVGFIGGFVSEMLAGVIYMPLNRLAMGQQQGFGELTTFGFLVQMIGRGLAWMAAGVAMGLGQGITLRSSRLLLYGFLGGLVGGLLGGLLFDPIDIIVLGMDKPSAHVSRAIGLATIGATVGAMIGIVELLARDAWLRMMEGPLAGKEFLIFKDLMKVGSSPRCDIYLFNDSLVAPQHAVLRTAGEGCDIETASDAGPVEINGRPCRRARLRHGDQITIGRTSFVFEKRGK